MADVNKKLTLAEQVKAAAAAGVNVSSHDLVDNSFKGMSAQTNRQRAAETIKSGNRNSDAFYTLATGKRPSTTNLELAQKQLAELEQKREARNKALEQYRNHEKFSTAKLDDTFWGQAEANRIAGRLSQDTAAAYSDYLKNPTRENKEYAEALSYLSRQFQMNNEAALDDENAVLPLLSKTGAGYLPQLIDQTVAGVAGAAAGAGTGALAGSVIPGAGTLTGALWGGRAGYVAGRTVQSFEQMRGAAFMELLNAGIDEETARAMATDEGFLSSLIEAADAIGDVAFFGGGKTIKAILSGGANALLKKGVSNATARNVVTGLAKYGLNIAGEWAEEGSQQSVSIANRNRDKAGFFNLVGDSAKLLGDVATGKNDEAKAEILEAANEGAKIAALMGGVGKAGSVVLDNYAATQVGKSRQSNSSDYDLVLQGLQFAEGTETRKLAEKISKSLDADESTETRAVDIGRLKQQMATDTENGLAPTTETKAARKTTVADVFKPKTSAQTTDTVQSMPTTEVEQVAAVQEANPDTHVVPTSVNLFMEAGDDSATAARKSEILARVTSGDTTLSKSQLRKLDLNSAATRAVLQSVTGQAVPQTNDTQTLLNYGLALVEQYAQANAEQAAIQSQIEAMAAEAAEQAETASATDAEQQIRQLESEATAMAQQAEAQATAEAPTNVEAAQPSQTNDSPVQLTDGRSVTREEFVAQYKAANPGKSDAAAQRMYADAVQQNALGMSYPAAVLQKVEPSVSGNVRLSNGRTVSKEEFASALRGQDSGMSDATIRRLYDSAVRANSRGEAYPAEIVFGADSVAQRSAGSQKRHSVDTAKAESQNRSESSVEASEGKFTKAQEWTVKRANYVLSKRAGGPKVALRNDLAYNVKGYYDKATKTVYLNANRLTTQQELTYTLGHELVHSVSGEQRTQLVNDICAFYEKIHGAEATQTELDNLRKIYIDQEMRSNSMSRTEAEAKVDIGYIKEELAADFMSELMLSTGGLNRLAKENSGWLQTLRSKAVNLMRDLKGKIAGNTEARALYNEAEALVDRMDRALKNAQPGDTMGTENTEQGGRSSVDREADVAGNAGDKAGSYDKFAERKEDFLARSRGALHEVLERGDIGISYAPYRGSTSGDDSRLGVTSADVKEALDRFGVESFIYEPGTLEVNRDNETYRLNGNEAVTIGRRIVGIKGDISYEPESVAAHEAFHTWSGSPEATEYKDRLSLHIDYHAPETIGRLAGIEDRYIKGKVDVFDEDSAVDTIVEELYAFISGALHNGEHESTLRRMLTDYDAVKSSWEELVQLKTGRSYTVETRFSAEAEEGVSSMPETGDEGAVFEENGKRYSITSLNHDIAEGKMFDDLVEAGVFTDEEVTNLRNNLNDLIDYMLPNANVLDMNERYTKSDRPFSVYKPNSDPLYVISLDFSTLCRKRLMTQYVIEQLQLRENRPMSAEEQVAIRSMLLDYRQQEQALQVACAMCYVEAARLKAPKQMERFFNDTEAIMRKYFAKKDSNFNAQVVAAQKKFKREHGYPENAAKKDMSSKDVTALNKMSADMRKGYTPGAEQQAIIDEAKRLPRSTFLTAANLTELSIKHPDIYAAYTDHIRASTRSKSLEGDVPYYYGDSRGPVSDSFVDSVNAENGMRFDSWSDFQMKHMLDMITAVIDLSVRGSKMHGYTKFPEMVRIFGKTGMQFNLSGVTEGNGLDENGNLIFSDTEGINFEQAVKLREEFPETAGLQCIGVSDDHIRALLRSEYVDYVIPYHTSGLNATLRKMAGIHHWKDYTGVQHATVDSRAKNPGNVDKWHVEPVWSEFYVPDGRDGNDIMQKTAQRYIDLCHERGLIPKFDEFKGETGYWKLLVDRKMINQETGQIIEQKPVKPIFDFDTIKQEIDREVENYDPSLEQRALQYVVDNFDAVHDRVKDLKKGVKKPLATMANEVLQAYAEGTTDGKISMKDSAFEEKRFADSATGENVKYSLRTKEPPKNVGIAYKVFYAKDGQLYPPMVANPGGAGTPVGVWLDADVGVAAAPSRTGRPQVQAGGKGTNASKGSLAFRPGWHLGDLPMATQFARKNPETGEKDLFPADFVWAECEYAMDHDYQEEAMSYGYTENGKFRHSYAGLPRLPEDGYYRYRTNPNPDTVPWVITGAMRVKRILTDAETDKILRDAGVEPMKRQGGELNLERLGIKAGDTTETATKNGKFSMKDSEGRELSAGQQEFFKDSKVRDEDGNLLKVYHGTPRGGFNEFSHASIGSTSDYGYLGRGFYFTSSERIAKYYAGYLNSSEVKTGYVNITNPYIIPTKRDLAFTLESIMGKRFDGEDADYERSVAFTEWLKDNGYDGVICKDEIMALNSNQFKNADNLNPTDDPDIRFSVDRDSTPENINPDTGYERGSVADSFMRIWNTGDREAALNVLEKTVERLNEMQAEQAEKRKAETTANTFRPAGRLTEDTIARNKRVIEELIAKYGKMDQTSAAQQEVRLPKQRDDKTKVRGFMQTAAAAEVTSEAVLNEFERAIVEGDAGATYVPIGDKGTLRRATEALEKEGFDSLLRQWEGKFEAGESMGKDDIAKAEQLYVEACNNRDTVTAMKLAAQIAVAGTQAGQAVQAMTLLKKMTPSGNLYYIQKAVDRLNKDQKGKHKDIVINEQLAKQLLEAETQEEIQNALDAICQDLANQMPVTLMDKWNTWRYLAMLGNPRTHIRNLLGNAVFTPARLMKDMLGATAEKALPVEQRTKAYTVSADLRDFAKQDAETMKDTLRGGGKYNPADMIRDKRRIFRSNVLNAAEQFNSAMLESEDWMFLKSAYSHALGSFLSARGADVSTISGANSTREGRALLEEARAYAVKEAQKATYRDMSKLAGTINHLKRNTGLVGEVFLEGLVPFTKTPINIVKRGIEYSPAGLVKGVVDMATKVRKGDMSAAEGLDELCAGLTGTAIVGIGALLTKLGLLVAGHSDDDEDNFEELQGVQEYSLKVGDSTFTVDWTAPVALPLFVGSEIYSVLSADADEDVDAIDAIMDGLTTMFEPMLSLSMLDGLNKTLSANKYGEEDDALYNIMATVISSYASQGVPTLFGQIARTVDDSRRTSFTPKGAGKVESWISRAFQTSVQGKIPVAAEGRMLYVDNWGRADTESNVWMRALENFVSPGYINEIKTSAVDEELKRLAEAANDTSVFPDRAKKYFSVDKEDYAMTQEEYQAHLIERGQHSYQLVSDITNDSLYAGLDDKTRAQAIKFAYEYAADIAKLNTNSEYNVSDKWKLRLYELEKQGGDVTEYLMLKAQAKINGDASKTIQASLGMEGFTDSDIIGFIVLEDGRTDSFNDPYTTKHEYVLNEKQKLQYEQFYRNYLAEEYSYLAEDSAYREASASEKYEMVKKVMSEVRAMTREAMSDWLWEQGIEPTPKN